MQRYFIEEVNLNDKTCTISGTDVHHIKNVMRLSEGGHLVVNTYRGQVFTCTIKTITKNTVICNLDEEIKSDFKPLNLTLGMSLIKKDHFELALQKATELGVAGFLPLKTENSIIKIDDFSKKRERYITILKEASEQCERTALPEINNPVSIYDIDYRKYDHVFVAFAREKSSNLLSLKIKNTKPTDNVLLVIGPEGGLTDKEIEFLNTQNIEFVSLGKTILRAETAAIYFVSAFKLQWEN